MNIWLVSDVGQYIKNMRPVSGPYIIAADLPKRQIGQHIDCRGGYLEE